MALDSSFFCLYSISMPMSRSAAESRKRGDSSGKEIILGSSKGIRAFVNYRCTLNR